MGPRFRNVPSTKENENTLKNRIIDTIEKDNVYIRHNKYELMQIKKDIKKFNDNIKRNKSQSTTYIINKKFSKFMKNKKNIKITQTDKGNMTTLIYKNHEKKLIQQYIKNAINRGCIQKITTKSPISLKKYHELTKKQAIEEVENILRSKTIISPNNTEKRTMEMVKNFYNKTNREKYGEKIPKLIATIKIHKIPLKIRPIISKIDTATIKIGNIINHVINLLNTDFQYRILNLSITNSHDLTEIIKNAKNRVEQRNYQRVLKNLPPIPYDFATLDINSMYDNINIHRVLDIIHEFHNNTNKNISVNYDNLKKLIEIDCKILNYFEYNKNIYLFKKGIPMGGNTSPIYADIYTTYRISKAIGKLKNLGIILIRKYVDDILIFGPRHNIQRIKDVLQETLKMDLDLNHEPKKSTIFLDMEIRYENNKISMLWYKKPSSSNRCLNSNSFIPKHIIRSNHIQRYKKALTITNGPHIYQVLERLINQDIDNNYPKQTIEAVIKKITLTNQRTNNILKFIIHHKIIKSWKQNVENHLLKSICKIKGIEDETMKNWIQHNMHENIPFEPKACNDKWIITEEIDHVEVIKKKHNLKNMFIVQYRGEDRNNILRDIFNRNNSYPMIINTINNFQKDSQVNIKEKTE